MSEGRRFPERPAIPALLYALATVVGVCRLSLWQGSVVGFAAGVALLLTLLYAVARWRTRDGWLAEAQGTLCVVAWAAWAALAVCAATLAAGRASAAALARTPPSSLSFRVTSDATKGRYGYRCRARAMRDAQVVGDVWLTADESLPRGSVVTGIGRFSENQGEWGVQSRMQGIWGSVKLLVVREVRPPQGVGQWPLAVRQQALRVLDPKSSDARAVVAGCVLGERTYLDERGLDQLFATCGVAHLVAVSGSHLAVVGALVAAVLLRLSVRPRVRLAVVMAVTAGFVVVCGAPPSAVRAWAMSVAAAGASVVGRRQDALSAVCLVGVGMALLDPCVTGQMGYLLSVACVVGLSLFSRYVAYAVDQVVPRVRLPRDVPAEVRIRLGGIREECVASWAATLVAQAMTLPVVGPVFARVSLVAPLAALLVSVPLSASLALGLVACGLWWLPPASRLVLVLCDAVTMVALAELRLLSQLPYASVAVAVNGAVALAAVLAGAAALLTWWPKPTARALQLGVSGVVMLTLCLVVRFWALAPARVCVLDVGQGDAILVQDGPHAVLVDTGPDDAAARALARNQVARLDAVVITHLHDDHYGGLDELVGTISCKEVLVARGVPAQMPDELAMAVTQLTGTDVVELSYGDRIVVGGFSLAMVWPRTPVSGTANPDSIELLVTYSRGGRSLAALLTGDAEQDELAAIIATGEVGDIDLLKVGHHGSEVSLTSEQARVLDPEVAVASAGEGNEYGHPRPECVAVLEDAGSAFFCTKDAGDVDVRPGKEGVVVRTQRCRP